MNTSLTDNVHTCLLAAARRRTFKWKWPRDASVWPSRSLGEDESQEKNIMSPHSLNLARAVENTREFWHFSFFCLEWYVALNSHIVKKNRTHTHTHACRAHYLWMFALGCLCCARVFVCRYSSDSFDPSLFDSPLFALISSFISFFFSSSRSLEQNRKPRSYFQLIPSNSRLES